MEVSSIVFPMSSNSANFCSIRLGNDPSISIDRGLLLAVTVLSTSVLGFSNLMDRELTMERVAKAANNAKKNFIMIISLV